MSGWPVSTDDRRGMYWRGYRHGKAIAEHRPHEDHERALRLEVALTQSSPHRAFALGELRGYRQATDRP